METWCSHFEFYGRCMDRLHAPIGAVLRIQGPHILDSLLLRGSAALHPYRLGARSCARLVPVVLVVVMTLYVFTGTLACVATARGRTRIREIP